MPQRSYYKTGTGQGVVSVEAAAETVASGYSNSPPPTRYIHSIYAMNRNAAARYIWVSTASAGGAVLAGLVMLIPPSGAILLDSTTLGQGGIDVGGNLPIFVAVSTSSTTYSAATAGEHDITVYYTNG